MLQGHVDGVKPLHRRLHACQIARKLLAESLDKIYAEEINRRGGRENPSSSLMTDASVIAYITS
jgi:hypothetical protein